MSAAAESLDRTWPDDVVADCRGPQERLEEALGVDFARRLIAALVGRQSSGESIR